ncbi:MAG: extracellular solute-binding protein [Clostridia bacterium]|nr:extracellular solute-binding protein [Clostridia bacterium]
MKKFTAIVLCLLCCLSLAACGSQSGGETVNIYSANYEDEIAIELEYLKEKFPDYEITITYLSSGKLAAKLMAEGADTEVDIAMSLSSGYASQLKEAGLLRAFDSELTYKKDFADPDGRIHPNGVWAGAIVINTDVLSKKGLAAPTSYAELIDPAYRDMIVMADPSSSSTGYFFLHGLLNLYGEEEGWKYFDALRENIMLFTESGSTPVSMVERGEAAIALGIDYQAMELLDATSPVEVVFAAEGAPYDYDTALLIERKKAPSQAVLDVMAAITSAEGNAVFNNYNLSVVEGEDTAEGYPEGFYLMDMTGISDPDRKAEVLQQWSARYE